jgi:hypothetical protein
MLPRVSAPRNSRASVSGSSTRSRPASRAARNWPAMAAKANFSSSSVNRPAPVREAPLAEELAAGRDQRCASGLVLAARAVDRETPRAGALTFGPALDWAQAALPQQNGKVLAELAGPVAAVITGPGARTIQIGPPGDPVTRITSDAGAFLRWVTQRATPEEAGAQMSGDPGQLALARSLRIFLPVTAPLARGLALLPPLRCDGEFVTVALGLGQC